MLSERKKHSIQEYLVDRNAAGAAVRSGYLRRGARQTGHRLLTVDDIATQIQKRAQVVAEKLEVDLETVIA